MSRPPKAEAQLDPAKALLEDPRPGERRGEITFASLIQQGMSANLYLVWHHRYWSAMICKIMRAAERDDQRWRELLEREGCILQKVSHPSIVRAFELNMQAELPYLLLEYLPGQSVRQVLQRKGRFSVQDAIRMTMHLGSILDNVHRAGYIHRDIKPSNVMLHCGNIKLLDFGVAWPLSDEPPPDKSGTPMYLAPEQCLQQPLTPAVDIWALGIFLFELLTGELPFPASDYHNYDASPPERYSQLTQAPKTLRESGRRVPAGLQQVLDRCLAQAPGERYPAIRELLIDLDRFCKIKIWPAQPGPDGTMPDLARFLTPAASA